MAISQVRCLTGAGILAAAVLMAVGASRPAAAQAPATPRIGPETAKKYRSFFDDDLVRFVDDTLVKDRRARNSRKFVVTSICKGSKPLHDETEDNRAQFDDYFMKFFFPMMTHPDELGNIANMRQELMKQYFMVIKNDINGQAVRDRLNALTLKFMTGVIGTKAGEFHPAVRFNAMLIVGDLDSRGAEQVGAVAPADPWNEALPVLLAELVSPVQIDAVKVAALIGLARHAELNRHRPEGRRIPDATIAMLMKPAMEIAQAKRPPSNRTPEGHAWMRRQAVDVLSHLGAVRQIGEVAAVIHKIVADAEEPLSLRCAAAEAQGRLLNPLAPGATAEEQVRQLGLLAVDCMVAELSHLKSFVDELESKRSARGNERERGFDGRGGGGLGILGGPPAGATTTEAADFAPALVATQRRLKHRAACINSGLFGGGGGPGLAAAVKDAAVRSQTESLRQALDLAVDAVDGAPAGTPPDVDLAKAFFVALRMQGAAIRDSVPSAPAAAEPAEASPAAPADEIGPAAGP